jgi:hypothetical protein
LGPEDSIVTALGAHQEVVDTRDRGFRERLERMAVLCSRRLTPGDLTAPNAAFITGATSGAVLPVDQQPRILATTDARVRGFAEK